MKSRILLKTSLALFILANILDSATTLKIGLGRELNPWILYIYHQWGIIGFWGIDVIFSLTICSIVWYSTIVLNNNIVCSALLLLSLMKIGLALNNIGFWGTDLYSWMRMTNMEKWGPVWASLVVIICVIMYLVFAWIQISNDMKPVQKPCTDPQSICNLK